MVIGKTLTFGHFWPDIGLPMAFLGLFRPNLAVFGRFSAQEGHFAVPQKAGPIGPRKIREKSDFSLGTSGDNRAQITCLSE